MRSSRTSLLALVVCTFWVGHTVKAQTDSLVIRFKDGTSKTIPLANISKVTFDTIQAGIKKRSTSTIFTNFPNPVFSNTQFYFQSTIAGTARILIFDLSGHTIKTLESHVEQGLNSIPWDKSNESGAIVRSGVYYYQLYIGSQKIAQKLLVE